MKFRFVFFLLPVLAVWSCNRQETEPYDLDFGYEYYPLQVGQSREFAVDSIIFDPALNGTRIDTNSWFIKETVADSFPAQDGLVWYRIECLQRQSDTLPWQIGKVYAAARNKQQAFRIEDNLKFVKMVFPLKANEMWDGNAAFSNRTTVEVAGEQIEMFKEWNSHLLSLGQPFSADDLSFPEVCAISLANSENIIEYRQGVEYYAKNTGLIYKELQIMDSQCQVCCNGDFGVCAGLTWGQKAEKGFIVRQKLLR